MNRAELIEAGARALESHSNRGRHGDGWSTEDDWRIVVPLAEYVLDAVEPLIRADERERVVAEYVPVLMEHLRQWANLRAKVEALRVEAGKGEAASASANYTQAAQEYAIERAAYESVLALIDGGSDD